MFEDKVDREDLEKMPDEYKDLLSRVLTIQADCEIGGPHLYVKDMLLSAPTKGRSDLFLACSQPRLANTSQSEVSFCISAIPEAVSGIEL